MRSAIETARFDAVIIGGGPAGSSVARLLARWGHSVLLITKAEPDGPTLAESLAPSCRKLFDVIGVLDGVDQAGFYRTRGNTVWWGEAEKRSENFAEGATGYQVVRGDFHQVLLRLAESGGAHVQRNSRVRQVTPPSSTDAMVARVEYEDAEGERVVVSARFTLDCSGRAGVIARQGYRRHERAHATLALVGVWRHEGDWGLEDETHTLVETYADGWAWSVPISSSVRYVTVMVDPRVTELERGERLEHVYRAELNKTRQFRQLVVKATLQDQPWGCDASLYCAHQYGGPGVLLVGDAASFIDPLSSFGVKKALASAWLAAVVVHTCLTKPDMQTPALEFFSMREQHMYASYLKQSARFFQEAASGHPHPFWTGRATTIDAGGTREDVDIDELRRDPTVLATFEELKRSPSIELRPTDQACTEKRPAILDREVILEDQLVADSLPTGAAGIRFLRGVDLPALVNIAGNCSQVPDLFDKYNRTYQPVILPDFLGALSVLLAKGILRNEVK